MSPTTGAPSRARSRAWHRLALGLAAGLAVAIAPAGVLAQSPSAVAGDAASPAPSVEPYPATVAAPGTAWLGADQAEWAARWWSWLLSFTADEDPSLATTCPASPADGPLILPQTLFGTVQQIDCTVASDRAVLVNAGGTICTKEPEDTEETLLACARDNDAAMSGFSIAVDGRLLPDIDAYRSLTRPFDIELPEDNLFGMPAGTVRAAASGRVALLSDLAPGTHTIVLRDEMDDPTQGRLAAETIVTLEVTE